MKPRQPLLGIRTRIERAVGAIRILLYPAGVTLVLSLAAGSVMRRIHDRR